MLFARCAASVLAIGVPATGCASHAGTPSSHTPTIGAPASTVVTAEELGRVAQEGSLMDALVRGLEVAAQCRTQRGDGIPRPA
jgi:hypothetical protein